MPKNISSEGALWSQWMRAQSRQPEKVVLVDAATGSTRTSRELTEEALRFFAKLEKYCAGERIAFRLPNGVEWFGLFLALQKAGIAAIPLDAAMPDAGCRDAARRFGARALYINGRFYSLGKRAVRKAGICCIKVTSGSGAQPKAVECRAGHLLADGHNVTRTMKIRPADTNLAVIPLGHSYGLGNLVMPLLLQGTAVVCAAEYVPRQLLAWMAKYRVTVFPGVPALFRVLASLPPEEGTLASLRTVISAGAVLTPAVARAFSDRFQIKIHNFYGSSETGGICYDRTGGASLSGRSVGRPLDGVRVSVTRRRIKVTSAAVATRSGSWMLGDFGEWNPRGELVLLGRAGQGANIGGKKVHPLEIERALRGLRGVTDASVWLAQGGGRDLLAAGVETSLTRGEIEQALAAQLPAWKLPKIYVLARDFPRNARGKLDVAALRDKVRLPAG